MAKNMAHTSLSTKASELQASTGITRYPWKKCGHQWPSSHHVRPLTARTITSFKRPVRQTLELSWKKLRETGWVAYGIFRALRYHIEVNELNRRKITQPHPISQTVLVCLISFCGDSHEFARYWAEPLHCPSLYNFRAEKCRLQTAYLMVPQQIYIQWSAFW